MINIKTRFFIAFVAFAIFTGPIIAVVAVEDAKRTEKLLSDKRAYAAAQKEAETARYQYYLDLTEHRNSLKQAMADAKAEYERLLKEQPELIKQGQHAVARTTIEPVTTQKVVTVPVTKPKSSSKTKSS